MATVLEMMELYRTMMALLKPLKGAFGSAWRIGGGLAGVPDFFGELASRINSGGGAFTNGGIAADLFGEFTSRINSGNTAAPRQAAGFAGLGAFNRAIGLPVRPEYPVRSDNGGFFYTGFGDKGASGSTGRSGQRGLDTFPEKIRGGDYGLRSAGGVFVLPDYGANPGMVLDNQLIGKQISGIGADGGVSGEFGNSGNSGENRGLLYSHRTFRILENPENGLVPNARTEEFDLWKDTEHLRIADSLKINDDVLSGERLAAVRGYAEREMSGFGGLGGSNINIDMSSMKNIVNCKSDMDELIDRLCSAIGEAAFSMAEGVHS